MKTNTTEMIEAMHNTVHNFGEMLKEVNEKLHLPDFTTPTTVTLKNIHEDTFEATATTILHLGNGRVEVKFKARGTSDRI